MSSKRWKIVCLTLTLLVCGCSDSELAKLKGSNQPSTVGAATSSSSRTEPDSNLAFAFPAEIGINEPLEIPRHFQPPGFDIPADHHTPFVGKEMRGFGAPNPPAIPVGIPQVDGKPDLPPLPGFDARPNAPVHFPGRSDGGSPIGPKEMLGLGLSGERPDLTAELPGFELPRYEGGFGAESLQLPQPEAIPAPPKSNEEARSSISDRR